MEDGPSLIAQAIRERLRVGHRPCDNLCPFKNLWAEDIQLILDMAEELKL